MATEPDRAATTVLCLEDDPRVRGAIAVLLADAGRPVLFATTVAEANAALETRPAVAILDLHLPDGDGLEVLRTLCRRWPGTPSIMLTVDDRPDVVLDAIRAGATGYVLKNELHARLMISIADTLAGGLPLSPSAARAVRHGLGASADERDDAGVTPAERRLLEHLALGYSYEQCALASDVSINTIRGHVRSLYRKLEVATKTEAVLEAIRRGLIARR